MKDIFDKDFSDIPEIILQEIGILKVKSQKKDKMFTDRILQIFLKKEQALNIQDLCIAYYRLFNEVKTLGQVSTKIHSIYHNREPKILKQSNDKNLGSGYYELTKEARRDVILPINIERCKEQKR